MVMAPFALEGETLFLVIALSDASDQLVLQEIGPRLAKLERRIDGQRQSVRFGEELRGRLIVARGSQGQGQTHRRKRQQDQNGRTGHGGGR